MKRHSCIFYVFIFIAAFPHNNVSAQWIQTNGPYGGLVRSFTSNGVNIFAGSHSGGVFLSTNGGQSWSSANSGLPIGHVISMVNNGSMIFGAAYENGVYRSTNNGMSWSAVNSGLANRIVWSLAIKDSLLLAGTDNGIFISYNNGSNWTPTSTPLPSTNAVRALAFGEGKIFAGTDGSGNKYCSNDTGKSWINLNFTSYGTINCITAHGSNVYVGTQYGIYASADTGVTWTSGMLNRDINSIAANDIAAIATSGSGIYRSTDYGNNWVEDQSAPYRGSNYCVTSSGSSFFVGNWIGIFHSTDNGISWTLANTGLCAMEITCFTSSNGTIFAGGWGGGIYSSTDNGESWIHDQSSYALVPNMKALAVSPSIGETGYPNIYAGGYGTGVVMSSNNGNSWTVMADGLDKRINALILHPTVDGFILFAGTQTGIYMSIDSAKNWTVYGLKDTVIWCLTIKDSYLFAGTSPWKFTETSQTLGHLGGVFASTNLGESWYPSGLPSQEVFSITFVGNDLIAKTPYGFFISTDEGLSWESYNKASPVIQNTEINCIAGINKNLFAGTVGKSVWRLPLLDSLTLAPKLNTPGMFFSNVKVGEFKDTTISIMNIGNDTLRILDILSSSAVFSARPIITNIPPGQSFLDTLRFTPVLVGPASGALLVFSNTPSSPDTIRVSGTGITVTGIEESSGHVPEAYSLLQNYPNPFNPSTAFKYQLPAISYIKLSVFDILGQEVVILVNGIKEAGYYSARFDGSKLSSGIYFTRLEARSINGNQTYVRVIKMLLIK